ncbi:hypothetical protein [Amnibacterium endophyticum]|uniref:Uncharacterized protein n=1 Tax=Amnibacterium endophyticum TaxID=2109337 RepID=A0ABW4L9I4_9MICO
MAVRDRLVAIVLAVGVLLGMAAWQAVTPWLGVAVVLAAVAGASVVYRLDVGRRAAPAPDGENDVSTPRRAAERP